MMKKLYEKSELAFALMWIGIYCVGMSIFDEISRGIGVESSASAVFAVAVSLFLYFWREPRKFCVIDIRRQYEVGRLSQE